MDDVLTCIECGSEISPIDKFCTKCKPNTRPSKPIEPPKINKKPNILSRFYAHPVTNVVLLLVGIWNVLTRDIETETLWFIVGVVIMITSSNRLYRYYKDRSNKTQNQATDILKERYAKGEISKDEFDKMKKDLE